jgi:hypothetical protein
MTGQLAIRLSVSLFCAVLTGAAAAGVSQRSPTGKVLSSLNLSKPFRAPGGWRFMAYQEPDIPDPLGEPMDKAPGIIRLCVSPDEGRSCWSGLGKLLASEDKGDLFSLPHFLNDARVVYARADLPLLLIQASSLHSGNGDQRVATTALVYDHATNAFNAAYQKQTGRNNNQEIRYIGAGPLRGAIISAEPTDDAPFGFWMTINRIGPDNRYRQVLRYRSATRYGDGNPLPVIDSEMPNIQQRLQLWRPGLRLPLPEGPCRQPQLIRQELWCSARTAT